MNGEEHFTRNSTPTDWSEDFSGSGSENNNNSGLTEDGSVTGSVLKGYLLPLFLGETIGCHVSSVYPTYAFRNLLIWTLIQIILGFHKYILLIGFVFLQNEHFDKLFKLIETYSAGAGT